MQIRAAIDNARSRGASLVCDVDEDGSDEIAIAMRSTAKRDGVLYELHFNPATAELMKTERD